MTVTASSLPPNENQEIIDFLRRLASMLSGGRNAEMLQEAASMIEALTRRAIAAGQLCQDPQENHARHLEQRETAEPSSDKPMAEVPALQNGPAEDTRPSQTHR